MAVLDEFGADQNNNHVEIIFMISRKCSKHVVLLAYHHFKTNSWKQFQIRFKLHLVVIRHKIRRKKSKASKSKLYCFNFFLEKSVNRAKTKNFRTHAPCVYFHIPTNRFRKVIRKLPSLVTEQLLSYNVTLLSSKTVNEGLTALWKPNV